MCLIGHDSIKASQILVACQQSSHGSGSETFESSSARFERCWKKIIANVLSSLIVSHCSYLHSGHSRKNWMSRSFFFVFRLLSLLEVAEMIFAHSIFEIVSKRRSCFEDH